MDKLVGELIDTIDPDFYERVKQREKIEQHEKVKQEIKNQRATIVHEIEDRRTAIIQMINAHAVKRKLEPLPLPEHWRPFD